MQTKNNDVVGMYGKEAVESLTFEIETIIKGKRELTTKDIILELGIAPKLAGWHLRTYIVKILRDNLWQYRSVRENGKITKKWVNAPVVYNINTLREKSRDLVDNPVSEV